MRFVSLLCGLALVLPATAENGYRNVVNAPHATVADGPLGWAVIDVDRPGDVAERVTRLRGASHRSLGRREAPPWFKLLQERGLLPRNQPLPAMPRLVATRTNGRLNLPDLTRSRQAGGLGDDANRLSFTFGPAGGDPNGVAWSAQQQQQISDFLNKLEASLLLVYGPPAFANTVRVVHDPALNELNMAIYDASNNEIRIELLNDVDHQPAATPIDEYDLYVLTLVTLYAYRDEAALFHDAWEDGMARAAQLLAISLAEPDFGFLARDFNLLFTAYDVLNQPGLGNPTFLGADSGSDAVILREALGIVRAYLAQAAWLKVYAENNSLFREFNDAYYAALAGNSALAADVPRLKAIVRGLAPQVEGLEFGDWYRRQHVLDTSLVPGAKLFVFNIPQKDFITGEPTNSLPMNVYHFATTVTGQQVPLTGRVTFRYFAYDEFDLTGAVQGASGTAGIEAELGAAGNPAGIASAVPLFFNIAGDQQVQQQRIEVHVQVNGVDRLVYFPNDVAADDNRARNQLYGLVTNGFQGRLTINIEGKDPIEADVIQGAFRARLPGSLPVPARATLSWEPDGSGGSQLEEQQRNVMFLGPIGSGIDVENGDAILIVDTPPEQFTALQQAVPAGLGMITVPAFARRQNESEILGVGIGELLMARADGAVATAEPYRLGSIYRLFPNVPAFRPGFAYWVKALGALTLQFDGVPARRDQPFRQHYPPGWQQFGNPFSGLNIRLGALRLQSPDGSDEMSLAEAQTRGLVSSGVFRYNRTTGGYALLGPNDVLTPFEGFWINILDSRGATIIYPNTVGAGSRGVANRGRSGEGGRWEVQLVATGDGAADHATRFGVAPGAGEQFSSLDSLKPPPFGPYVQVSFPHTQWGAASGRYAVDLREANGAAKSWDLAVETNLPEREVSLSWPNLAEVPSGVSLVLEDLDSGAKRFMRSTGGYRFPVEATAGRRRLRITAEPMRAGRLQVLDLRGVTTRAGGSVFYQLSAPAEVTIFLASQSGRRLGELVRGRASGTGQNEVPFRAVDATGRPLPRGIYRLEMIAVGEDGQQQRTSRVVRVER